MSFGAIWLCLKLFPANFKKKLMKINCGKLKKKHQIN